jgi:hypothetical protein
MNQRLKMYFRNKKARRKFPIVNIEQLFSSRHSFVDRWRKICKSFSFMAKFRHEKPQGVKKEARKAMEGEWNSINHTIVRGI